MLVMIDSSVVELMRRARQRVRRRALLGPLKAVGRYHDRDSARLFLVQAARSTLASVEIFLSEIAIMPSAFPLRVSL